MAREIPGMRDQEIDTMVDIFPELFATLRPLRLHRLEEGVQIDTPLDQGPPDGVGPLREIEEKLIRPVDPFKDGCVDLLRRRGSTRSMGEHPWQLVHEFIEASTRLIGKGHRVLLRFVAWQRNRRTPDPQPNSECEGANSEREDSGRFRSLCVSALGAPAEPGTSA